MSRLREHLPRFAAEFVIVFLSIVLALVADDWRTTRDDRAREAEILQLLLRDLEEDTEDMMRYRDVQLPELEAGDLAFLRGIEAGVSSDSLVALRGEALGIWNYRPTYPTWDGLVQDGQLGLIRDAELRSEIVDYHSDALDYLRDVLESRRRARADAAEFMERHFGQVPGSGLDEWVWVLRTSPEAVRADPEALNALGGAARSRSWTRIRLDDVFLPGNIELQTRIRAALEG